MLDQRAVEAVIVYASDRLTRNLAHLLLLREQMAVAGVELHYCTRGKSENSPEGQMTENIEGVFNEYWRAKIAEGSMRGRNKKAETGHCVLGGRPPFGYRVVDGRTVIHAPEAAVVRQIFAWYTYGEDTLPPFSLMEITRRLNDSPMRTQRGGQWSATTVLNLLKREMYAGVAYYGKTRKGQRADGKRTNVKQPPDRWVRMDVADLALVDAETFQAAQKRLDENKHLAARNTRHDYLLRGRLRCGRCGRRMSCIKSHNTARGRRREVEVYRCNQASRTSSADRICGASCVARKVDEPFWEWLVALLQDEVNLERGLNEMRARAEAALAPRRQRIATIDSLIERAESKVQRLIATFAGDDDAGDIAQAAVKAQVRAIGKERDALRAEREMLIAETRAGEFSDVDWEAIRRTAAAVSRRTAYATRAQMRLIVDALDVQAVLRDGEGGRWLDVTCALLAEDQVECITLTDSPESPPAPGQRAAKSSPPGPRPLAGVG
jgi:site-specific DNA recombinase